MERRLYIQKLLQGPFSAGEHSKPQSLFGTRSPGEPAELTSTPRGQRVSQAPL